MQRHYQPGDVVARRKGPVMHKGVVLGEDRILHNTPWRGEHVSTEREFRAGRRLRVTPTDRQIREQAVGAGAAQENPRRYNLFTNNCEHTVNRITTGRPTSPQLQGWMVGAGMAVVAFAVLRHPLLAVSAFAAGRGLVKKLQGRDSGKRDS